MNWNKTIRDSECYDSSNPCDWFFYAGIKSHQELRPDFIQSVWSSTKNKIFAGAKANDYTVYNDGESQMNTTGYTDHISSSVRELLVYGSAMAKAQVIKITNYIKKITR